MPDLATVAMSVVGSFIGAFVVAYTNNRFQRDKDELKTIREKAELIVAGLKRISEIYIDKYNYACECRSSKGEKHLRDKFGFETKMYNAVNLCEDQVYALTQIYFPSCQSSLDEWQGKLGWADGILRSIAAGQLGENDYLSERSFDKPVCAITDISAASSTLRKGILQQVALARSVSPYTEMLLLIKSLLELPRKLLRSSASTR